MITALVLLRSTENFGDLTRVVFIQQTSSDNIYRGILTVSGKEISQVVK